MADKKTYYYLKLKEGFFDSEDMLLLQGMKDGYIYSDILLKLYLMSLRQDGRLMYAPNAGNSTAPDQQCRERIGKQKYVLTVEQSRHLTL